MFMCFYVHVSNTKLTFKVLKYEIKNERKQKPPFNKTQVVLQKRGVWFMQSNSHTHYMDIHVHNIFVGSYF